jgi:Ca-activated chloride channel family protein
MQRIRRLRTSLVIAVLVGFGAACALDKSREVASNEPATPSAAGYSNDAPASPTTRASQAQLEQLRSLGYLDGGGAAHDAHSMVRGVVPPPDWNTERYDFVEEDGFLSPGAHPLSTFSIDVDTASYSNVRRFLEEGQLPPLGAVRIEELVNYFRYDRDAQPDGHPFAVSTELTQAPWAEDHLLLRVGLRADEIQEQDLPPRNLVFLIDVSGSMQPADKLPLLQRALRELVLRLRPEDRVAMVVYAGASGLVLPPTPGKETGRILDALERLRAGGSTHGSEGIELAYEVARQHFDPEAINRVILATDGDFNVGVTSRSELVRLIERERESGVFLSILGVGRGNLNDAGMEQLADHGNGNYAYLDGMAEARKVLVREAGGTLVAIAKDVKVQVEFNPSRVSAYRLIGYENRRLEDRDFNDDRVDAGEIGAGHSVTAFYEIVPVGVEVDTGDVDPLRYQRPGVPSEQAAGEEWLTVKLRYKRPDEDRSRRLASVLTGPPHSFGVASEDLRFGGAVALFGMLLQRSEFSGDADWSVVHELARSSLGDDPSGQRAEFLQLVARARDLEARREESLSSLGGSSPRL